MFSITRVRFSTQANYYSTEYKVAQEQGGGQKTFPTAGIAPLFLLHLSHNKKTPRPPAHSVPRSGKATHFALPSPPCLQTPRATAPVRLRSRKDLQVAFQVCAISTLHNEAYLLYAKFKACIARQCCRGRDSPKYQNDKHTHTPHNHNHNHTHTHTQMTPRRNKPHKFEPAATSSRLFCFFAFGR